jgi:hypothetical protein
MFGGNIGWKRKKSDFALHVFLANKRMEKYIVSLEHGLKIIMEKLSYILHMILIVINMRKLKWIYKLLLNL